MLLGDPRPVCEQGLPPPRLQAVLPREGAVDAARWVQAPPRDPPGPADIQEMGKVQGFVPEKQVRILLRGAVSYFWRQKCPNPLCWPRQRLSGSVRTHQRHFLPCATRHGRSDHHRVWAPAGRRTRTVLWHRAGTNTVGTDKKYFSAHSFSNDKIYLSIL